MKTAPSISNHLWQLSKFVLDQLNSALISGKGKQKLTANLQCQLALTEFGQQLPHSTIHRQSTHQQIDFLDEKSHQSSISSGELVPVKNLNNSNNSYSNTYGEEDTFEHILKVTNNQEAVYAYYYMDENNKVWFSNI